MATANFSITSSGFGSAKLTIFFGKTSNTPPTLVETTNKPHDAASTIAIQNASVKEVLRKIWPRTRTSLTL